MLNYIPKNQKSYFITLMQKSHKYFAIQQSCSYICNFALNDLIQGEQIKISTLPLHTLVLWSVSS